MPRSTRGSQAATPVKTEDSTTPKVATPTPTPTPTRAIRSSTRGKPPVNYNDDDVDSEPKKEDEGRFDFSTPAKKRVAKTVDSPTDASAPSPSSTKKLAMLDASIGVSPYPKYSRPTPEECEDIYERLCKGHGVPKRPKVLYDKPGVAAGCGQTPDVLDALIRTLLSQNTTSKNSTAAKNEMDREYGRADHRKVLEGGEEKLAETIRCGGLAKVKAKSIIKIMRRIDEKQGGKGQLNLDYLHLMSDRDAMKELCSFDLIGVKTASCVLLFCLGRDSFAVDTHVHRITMALGWVPPSATRDTAFFHLDVRIPNHLKYGLHSLLVRHGRGCEKCAANGVTSMDHIDWCPLQGFVSRSGKKGGGGGRASPGKKVIKRKVEDDEEEVETKIEIKDEGEAIETTTIATKQRTSRRSTAASVSSKKDQKEVVDVKKRKIKVDRGVEDDEREMSGYVQPESEMSKTLQDDDEVKIRPESLH